MFPRRQQSPTLPGGFAPWPHRHAYQPEATAMIFFVLFVAFVISGVSVMRRSSYNSYYGGNAVSTMSRTFPSVVPSEVSVAAQPEELSLSLRVALLSMGRDYLSRAVVSDLKERQDVPRVFISDFQALAGLGLATRPTTGRYHVLTGTGEYRLDDIRREIAQQFSIHVFDEGSRGYGSSHSILRCTCGWRGGQYQTGSRRNLLALQERHLRSVEAATGLREALTVNARAG